MEYVRLENSTPVEWPIYDFQIRGSMKNVSLPTPLLPSHVLDYGFEQYTTTEKPEFNALIQTIEERTPVKKDSVWEQQWVIVEKYSQADRDQILADEIEKQKQEEVEALQDSIVNAVQKRLDDFARTRNYDGILSAATYATSTNTTFQAEGQRAVQLRDDTWQALYNILGQVATQGRVVNSFEDIEGDLPVLSWT